MALCGVTSRRASEEIILKGRVMVNGETVDYMGCEVDPDYDTVEVDGIVIKPEAKKYYILLNKPKGYVTTVSDEFDRPTVMELVKDVHARIYPVGRLDYDTAGLLIMTNDGDFANVLTHPSHAVNKGYIAKLNNLPDNDALKRLREGVELDGRLTSPAKVEVLNPSKHGCEIKITIHEGRNRQVRRMFEAVGAEVTSLKRISVGNVTLGNLPEGKWRHLNDAERQRLMGRGKKNHSRSKTRYCPTVVGYYIKQFII
ncbi:MAG: rRNA pseudouridine synthase [Clostridia bacterium]|nr:rRNA pseudouridine synthase [Clostridia bacterium]